MASVCERETAPARLSGKCLGSPLRGPARAEGRAGSTDPSHPDPSACSSRTRSREPSAGPRPCPARPLPESVPAASCVKRGAAAPRESSQERSVTRGVCDSVPPPPTGADLDSTTDKGRASRVGGQIRKVDGPGAGSVPPRTAAAALGGSAPPQHLEHSPGLAGPRVSGDSAKACLIHTRCS